MPSFKHKTIYFPILSFSFREDLQIWTVETYEDKNEKCSVRIFLSHRHRIFSTISYYMRLAVHILRLYVVSLGKGKAVPLQACSGPEGSRKLRFPDYMTTAQDGGKVVSPTQRPPLSPGNAPGTHFCYRLSRPQGHSAIGRIMSMKNSNDTIWNPTSDLPICSTEP
jgi:hypothetical protein